MRAAIYARKSTDDNDKNPDNKSVTRQVDRARAYAAARGWTIAEEHIYVDDGISGAEFRNRPALLRMLNRLREFDIIIMSELSRLGREMANTATVLGQIRAANVRVWHYLTDEELKFDSATDKFMVSAVSFAAELEREKASQRARDALLRKAERGFNTGGRVYGYDNVPVYAQCANGQEVKSHTDYRINPEEASVVRAIFRMYADGRGMKAIAWTLNADPAYTDYLNRYFGGHAPQPPRTGSWSPTRIREMLYRQRYLGKIPFGEYRKVMRAGSRAREKQDRYLLFDRPDLRIIDEALWERVQTCLRVNRKAYLAARRDKCPKPTEATHRTSRYLLSGLMHCGCCHGPMVTTTIAHGSGATRHREPYYLCSYHHNRGNTVCENRRGARLSEADARVIEAIERTVLTPAALDYLVDRVVDAVRAQRATGPNRAKQLETELRRLRGELDRFIALIAGGKAPERVLEEIATRESRLKDLESELTQLKTASPRIDAVRIRELATTRAKGLHATLHTNVAQAREALKLLLAGPITFKLDGSGYRLEGQTRIGPLFAAEPSITRIRLASPTGFEPVLPP